MPCELIESLITDGFPRIFVSNGHGVHELAQLEAPDTVLRHPVKIICKVEVVRLVKHDYGLEASAWVYTTYIQDALCRLGSLHAAQCCHILKREDTGCGCGCYRNAVTCSMAFAGRRS